MCALQWLSGGGGKASVPIEEASHVIVNDNVIMLCSPSCALFVLSFSRLNSLWTQVIKTLE